MKAKEEQKAEGIAFSEVESTYDSTSEISFIRNAITIDVDNSSSVSYSLDGITFEPYNQPITADGSVDLTLEVAGDTGSNLFLSSGVTCSFERAGN